MNDKTFSRRQFAGGLGAGLAAVAAAPAFAQENKKSSHKNYP